VYKALQIWNPANKRNGVTNAKTKRVFVMAKNAPPSGDAKKRPTSTAVPIVGKTALISSRGPFGPCGDGGNW